MEANFTQSGRKNRATQAHPWRNLGTPPKAFCPTTDGAVRTVPNTMTTVLPSVSIRGNEPLAILTRGEVGIREVKIGIRIA
jgi:hypothetical protein